MTQYEEEVKPTPVLIDIEAGNRTNMLNEVFHLPISSLDDWKGKVENLHKDLVKSMLGVETSVGFDVGQQHIVDFLQKNCSQQHILVLASNFLYSNASKHAKHISNRPDVRSLNQLLDKLKDLLDG